MKSRCYGQNEHSIAPNEVQRMSLDIAGGKCLKTSQNEQEKSSKPLRFTVSQIVIFNYTNWDF